MKSSWENLLTLVKEGRLTLQIPQFYLGFRPLPTTTWIDFPDNWFCFVKNSNRLSLGKEGGFLYWSRIGYEANKEKIISAYINGVKSKGVNLPDADLEAQFANYAKHKYSRLRNGTKKEIQKCQDRINEAIAALGRL
jgi:hypothetical protein